MLTAIVLAATAGLPAFAQGTKPLYTVEIQSGSTRAVDYAGMGGSAKIGFRGTVLATSASGEAKVASQGGVMSIDASFRNLEPASKYGPEYMTYVLWAVSPEGRANNLGEVLLKSRKGQLRVTTRLPIFALIVTAEPYFAVSQVGDVVVLENTVEGKDAKHTTAVNYGYLPRGQYTINVDPADLKAPAMDKKTPPDLYQARNAVNLARGARADKFAASSYLKAADLLAQAERNQSDKKGDKKAVVPLSRHAVQQAEDSRQLAIRMQADEQVASEKRVLKETAAAEKRSIEEKAAAERQSLQEQAAAERQAMAERAASEKQAMAERAASEKQAMAESAAAEKQRMAESAAAEKQAMAAQVLEAQKEAAVEASRRAAAQQEAEQARFAVAQSEREQAQLRGQLREQLNAIMKTTDSARGLIVSMTGLLFETGKSTLVPKVRENLARVAGILLGHPGLEVEVEGHTDSVGSDVMNQNLSENRAKAVREYLLAQGVPEGAVVSRGFGKTKPLATNDTAEGRSQNRRVEIVVSGEPIGADVAAR
jgi:outer membrane protein OmpA-like peptidoglycan-associated protein